MAMNKCPKCGCAEIDSGWIYSAGKVVYKSDKTGYFSAGGECKRYVCTGCGYVETYVDPEYLSRIKEKRK
jgi:predicted nucleic-acid-binding Zn-ribbon protein